MEAGQKANFAVRCVSVAENLKRRWKFHIFLLKGGLAPQLCSRAVSPFALRVGALTLPRVGADAHKFPMAHGGRKVLMSKRSEEEQSWSEGPRAPGLSQG